MSWSDIFLLEPYPFELWIAYRTDGQKGTGTLNDPLNGAARYDDTILHFATTTPLTYSGPDATATTSSAHGFAAGDAVTVEGISGDSGDLWNGTFVIYDVPSTTTFKFRLTATPTGSPATSGAQIMKLAECRLDTILRGLTTSTHVHLGETPEGQPFLTRGYIDGGSSDQIWQMKPGMRLSGAGMDATVLKLVPRQSDGVETVG